jgi:N-acetylneuraminic acid mutarotase
MSLPLSSSASLIAPSVCALVASALLAIAGCAETSNVSVPDSEADSSGSAGSSSGSTVGSSSGNTSSGSSGSGSAKDAGTTSSSGNTSSSGGPVDKGAWTFGAEMPTPRRRLGVTRAPDGRIFAIGGETTSNIQSAVVEIYDPVSNAWSTGPSLPATLSWSGAATGYDGKIYVLSASTNNYVFNATNNSWSSLAPAPEGTTRTAFTLVPIGHKIAVVGGADSLVLYDIDTNTWSSGPAYPEVRSAPAAAVDSTGALLMLGGFKTQDGSFASTSSVYRLAAGGSAWQLATALPTGVGLLGATTDSSGRVIAIGGQTGGYINSGANYLANVSVLHNGSWAALAPLNDPRISAGVCADANGKVYVIGGQAALPNSGAVVVGSVEIFTP